MNSKFHHCCIKFLKQKHVYYYSYFGIVQEVKLFLNSSYWFVEIRTLHNEIPYGLRFTYNEFNNYIHEKRLEFEEFEL